MTQTKTKQSPRETVNTVRHHKDDYEKVKRAVSIIRLTDSSVSINSFSRQAIEAAADRVIREYESIPQRPITAPPFKVVS